MKSCRNPISSVFPDRLLPNFAKPLVKFCLILMLLLVLPLSQVFAETIHVDATCTLEQAIASANTNSVNGGCKAGDDGDDGGDIITITREGTTNGTIIVSADLTFARESKLTINGGGFTLSGGDSTRIFDISSSSTTLTLNNMTIIKGWESGDGGAIFNRGTLTINNSTIKDNEVVSNGFGGAISNITDSNGAGGTVTINNSTISDNDAGRGGGAIYSYNGTLIIKNSVITRNEARSNGGGIDASYAEVTISNSSITDNTSLDTYYPRGFTLGGGGIYSDDDLNISNSTIAGNQVNRGKNGGGIFVDGALTLTHVTIVNNSAAGQGDGLYFDNRDARNRVIHNSILANNGDSDCWLLDVSKPLAENVGNLIRNPGNCGAGKLNADPMLGSLTGRPAYYPLQAGSPAIDAASSAHCTREDQRGQDRSRKACDIGAYEWRSGIVYVPKTPEPRMPTCPALLPGIDVTDLTGATQCQRIDAGGVGIQSVIDRGIVNAVDVWGFMGAGTRVCFLASGGSFSFLNAATAPRSVSSLPLYVIEGKTCTLIDGPGSIVLHPGAAPAGAATSNGPARGLSNCMVTTTDGLNFRAGPGGEVIGGVPNNATLTALSRTAGWFEVDYHGVTGWISAQYVTPNGDCG